MIPVMQGASFASIRFVSRLVTVRACLLTATFAVIALLGMPQAWATPAPTTTSLTVASSGSAVTSVADGTVVTLTATVTSGSAPVHSGQVRFCVATAAHCEDSALLATAQLTSAGTATYKFRPGGGSHSYLATFVGTNLYAKSKSSMSVLAVANPTTTTIASSGPVGNYTLTATVAGRPGSALPLTGDISFLDTTNGNASLGAAALGTAMLSNGFTTGVTYGVGSAPTSVAVGDFNGDGIPDLATANSADNTMTVQLGKGDGTFTLKSSSAVGDAPYSFAVGDFNGDGILDLAVANCGDCSYLNYNSNTVTVLLGNGDGTFTTKSTLTVGTAPEFVAVGDFNGDGVPDLAVANGSDNTVTVLLGNGDGTFTTKSTLTVGAAPRFLVASDFNGDGILDLAVASQDDNTVTVLLGNGDGTFTLKSSITVSSLNLVLVVGDFNGDGLPDLATANDGVVTVLLGNGDGTFTTKTSPAPDYFYVGMVVGDFNGDGILDLALSSCGSHCFDVSQVPVLLGNGDGTFSAGPMLTPGYLPFALATADFNGDGTLDLASASFDDDKVTVLLNQITETATATLSNVSVSGTETHLVEANYPGDTNFNSSTSTTVPLLATNVVTTLNLSSSVNPAPPGYLVVLRATLTPYSFGSFTTDGEMVIFYSGATNIGTGILSSGVATLNTTSLPAGTDMLTAVYTGGDSFAATTSNSLAEKVTTSSGTVPTYVVTTNTDDTAGVASNCTGTGSSSCSLRDTLAAAAATGAGEIIFDSTTFGATKSAASRTITLANGTLNLPSNATITGLTTGTGATLTNLVTVNSTSATGYNQNASLFAVATGVTNAAIANLTVTGANVTEAEGGGISNHGALTIANSTISNNLLHSGNGAGIYNDGTLTIADSTISNNYTYGNGGGIYSSGTLTIASSTITGNGTNGSGFGIDNTGTLTVTNSTLTEDCVGNDCPANGSNNNIVGNPMLASLGNYGGPTPTQPPLPGSPAICTGVSTGASTDQRGLPRRTTYGSNTCIDSGAVQTNFSLAFSTEPPANIPAGANFTAAIQLSENGSPFRVSGIVIPLALSVGEAGLLNVSSLTTNSAGSAASSTLQVAAPVADDTLVTSFALTASGVTPALSLSATSNLFNVTASNMQVTIASSPAGLMVTVDGVSYSTPATLTWAVGSQHTLAEPSPQTLAGAQYTFVSWSDGGSDSHTVTATTATTSYTATFTATMYQLNISANPSSEGTIASPSGNFYAPGTVVNLIATPKTGYWFTSWTGATTGAIANAGLSSTTITMSAPESVTANFAALPSPIVVTTVSDDATGAANCPSSSNCSLRDALAAAAAAGVGNIIFDPHVFATPQTITVTGGLTILSNTTINITGPTTGSGASLTNLVTVSGGGPVITVNAANAAISNLTITGGAAGDNGGGGIFNGGVLTVSNSTISENSASGSPFANGGGIENYGFLTLINSTVTGNSVSASAGTDGAVSGGGIDNQGTLTITNSTIVGNSASIYNVGGICSDVGAAGGGINNYGTLTMTDSIVAGNSASAAAPGGGCDFASGAGIAGPATGANNIVSGNIDSTTISYIHMTTESEDDGGFTNGQNGNFVGPNALLAPLGSYGGPTQTAPPLPGSPAICVGVVADIPPGVTTDQRGFPRTTTYGTNPPCVDSGAVQTNYSLRFSMEPPSTIPAHADFAAAVQLNESGSPFKMSGFGIALALAPGNNGSLIGSTSLSTNSVGIAVASQLQVTAPGSGDKLVATPPLSASGVAPAVIASTMSTAMNVTASNSIQVTVGTAPVGPALVVDGVSYSAPVTLTWTLGSQHTLVAASPQYTSGTQYSFAGWSDGGAMSHSVTASATTLGYTAIFNVAYLLTLSANPSQGGTVSPASGVYYPAGSILNLTATPNLGYGFAGWTGNVASASSASTTITMSAPEIVTASFNVIPNYVVTTNLDDAGTAANCTTPGQSCSLRDALAAATATASGADISFDATIFGATQTASARTITLGKTGTFNLPSNTRIFGPTTGSGATLTPLVTVKGSNGFTDFASEGVTNVVLSGLNITGGYRAVHNTGTLTVTNCTISGNSASQGAGAGVYNGNILLVTNSVISGNTSLYSGAGIMNDGALTVVNSTISGNSASLTSQNFAVPGGGIASQGALTVTASTISGNSGGGLAEFEAQATVSDSTISGNNGGGLEVSGNNYTPGGHFVGTLIIVNSTVSGNSSYGIQVDSGAALMVTDSICTDSGCPTNGTDGNVTGATTMLAPLANYGGPTQTMPPLPGSPAICAGLVADIPPDVITDQRGFPRTTNYGSNPPCVDSGAVQTNYSLRFSTEPPAIVTPNVNFTAAVQLSESGNPISVSGITVPLALGAGSTGSLSGGSAATSVTGTATYSSLQVNAAGSGDTLVATLPLTTSPPPPSLTSVISIAATSSPFDVEEAQTITFPALASPVTYGIAPITLHAVASSGLPVSYSVIGPATVTGSTLTITGAGTVTVTASQTGSNTYAPAANVSQSVIVSRALLTVTANNASMTYNQAISQFTYTPTGFANGDTATVLSGAPSEATTAVKGSLAGTYPITITQGTLAAANYSFEFAKGTLTISSAGTATLAWQFVPVTGCRIADTRGPLGPFGGPEVGAETTREFDIPGACDIPSTAVAYSLNVTVVPNGFLNYLTLWPSGQIQPYVSTLNSDGRIKANAAIVEAGVINGGVSVFVSDATNVILDINGYFVPAGTASALAFYPVTPCRVADTRGATGPLGGPSISGGSSRDFPVQSGSCNIPSTAKAYSLNVTAVPHKTLNYLTTWPTGQPQPPTSTLNAPTGTVVANTALVAAGTSGDVSIHVSDDADVILDINGYFAPPVTGGLSFYTVTPCRAIDTRQSEPPFPGTLTVSVQGSNCAPPATAAAYVLNATVVPSGSFSYLTLWPGGENKPYVSTLNAYDGAITSNMAIVPTNNGAIDAYSPGPGNLILDLSGYFAP